MICTDVLKKKRTTVFFKSTHLSVRSPLCRLKSREGTILSMCCGSQMFACSSSFTVFLTTPCRPLIPAMRILQVTQTSFDGQQESTNASLYTEVICFRLDAKSVCFQAARLELFNAVYFQKMPSEKTL